ncbi:MAG: RNA-directed DNA polymerase, partial [Chlorobiales bacterium]|nr:RNA-directed DNA polymerase [Chlorobiales bacterium]
MSLSNPLPPRNAASLTELSILQTKREVASLLGIKYKYLIYYIHKYPHDKRYTSFQIPKKSGGVREILSPIGPLKFIQRRLSEVLLKDYKVKPSVYGFVKEKSILKNAQRHVGKRYVFNADLKDFFPSINSGRVRGMFMSPPYSLNKEVATFLTQICCHNNALPAGAPTSPIISNIICRSLDNQLQELAKENRCTYTRYVDDITFSTTLRSFPQSIAHINEAGQIEAGSRLNQIVSANGFQFNSKKVRLQAKNKRQEVTGLTVNEKPNITRKFSNQIRAIIHAIEKYGLEAAEKEFLAKHQKKHRNPKLPTASLLRVLKGKIDFLGMVRGKCDPLYLKFLRQLKAIAPQMVKDLPEPRKECTKVEVWTEGKTDWKHLKAAFTNLKGQGYYINLEIDFKEFEDSMGEGELFKHCPIWSKTTHQSPLICIFDRDIPTRTKEVMNNGRFKDWTNNVFSFTIPVPEHRQSTQEVCIELYYKDSELKREDSNARRLFLSNEFDAKTTIHKEIPGLICPDKKAKDAKKLTVIDNNVYHSLNHKRENIALPKDDFASKVLAGEKNFDDFDFSQFKKIFDVIVEIADFSRRNYPSNLSP